MVVRPGWGDHLELPAVRRGGVKTSSEQSGDGHLHPREGAKAGTGELGRFVGGAGVRVGITVASDSLARVGVEDAVACSRDDHD